MKIGELSRRTEVPIRMLRYYEERGLIQPSRTSNGYRAYAETDVARVSTITSLVRSGLTTRLIVSMLHGDGPTASDAASERELVELLRVEKEKLEAKIACMTLSRDTIESHLERLGA